MASGLLASQMIFSGDSDDPYAADDFISRFEAFATSVKWDDAKKKDNVGMYLSSWLKDWYKSSAFTDWDDFKTQLKGQFDRRFTAEAAETALQNRKKQPSESFDKYYYDVIKLLKQAKITDPAKSVKHLMKGLTPTLATQLQARKPTTTAAVRDVFHEWEELQNLMGLEALTVSTSTTPKEPPQPPKEWLEEFNQLKHTVRKQSQVINSLQSRPDSRSRYRDYNRESRDYNRDDRDSRDYNRDHRGRSPEYRRRSPSPWQRDRYRQRSHSRDRQRSKSPYRHPNSTSRDSRYYQQGRQSKSPGRPYDQQRSRTPEKRIRFGQNQTRYYDDRNYTVATASSTPADDVTEEPTDLPWPSTVSASSSSSGVVPHLIVYIQGTPLLAMIDTGASDSIIRAGAIKKLPGPFRVTQAPKLYDFNGRLSKVMGLVELPIALSKGSAIVIRTLIVDHAQQADMLLGTDYLKARGLMLDSTTDTVSFSEPARGNTSAVNGKATYTLPYWLKPGLVTVCTLSTSYATQVSDNLTFTRETTDAVSQPALPPARRPQEFTEAELNAIKINPELQFHQHQQLKDLISKYRQVFAYDLKELGKTDIMYFRIPTEGAPVNQSPYPRGPKEMEILQKEIDNLMEAGLICESNSDWSSPCLLVKKKDGGSYRLAVDYRKLNKVLTTIPSVPLPRTDQILHSFYGHRYFTTLDMLAGYNQIAVFPDDVPKTAFATPVANYEWKYMPFGIATSPGFFSAFMRKAFSPLLRDGTMSFYLDDIFVSSSTWEEHMDKLSKVLQAFKDKNLTLKPTKCYFAHYSVTILGHVISSKGISTDPGKVIAITNMPAPHNLKTLRSFLGMASYYRKFIPFFSELAKPLTNLTRADEKFKWDEPQQTAFDKLKEHLTSPPILAFFDPQAPIVLATDASDYAIGSVLQQRQEGTLRVLEYASRSLTDTESRYSTCEKEMLAVVWSVERFRHYLFETHFTIISDNCGICYLKSAKYLTNNRLLRWSLKLQSLNFDIEHKKGTLNVVPDCLSRLPQISDTPDGKTIAAATAGTVLPLTTNEIMEAQQDLPLPIRWTPGFKVINDLIHYKTPVGYRIYLPKCLTLRALQLFHDEGTSGHAGV